MKILLTYFEPFGGEATNASEECANLISHRIGDCMVFKLRLPVSYRRSAPAALIAISSLTPDCVLCLGQARSRHCICLERRAVNSASSPKSDNDGIVRAGELLSTTAQPEYLTILPVDDICTELCLAGIKCKVSESAGKFVCNALYYEILRNCRSLPALFVHLPAPAVDGRIDTADRSQMSPPYNALAIRKLIETLARYR